MTKVNPVDEDKVFDAMKAIKPILNSLNLNEHEKIVVLKNLLAHEENVLERKNFVTVMFSALNKTK